MTFAQPRDMSYVGDDRWPPGLVPPEVASLDDHLADLQEPDSGEPGSWQPVQAGPWPSAVNGHCTIELAIGPESAKTARDFTTQTLRSWDLDDLAAEAVLIATELVTNAIRHGGCCASGLVELAWQRDAGRVICVVTDGSAKPPVLAPDDPNAESGRGLQVVQALAAAWGWMLLGVTRKAVWAAMPFTPSAG